MTDFLTPFVVAMAVGIAWLAVETIAVKVAEIRKKQRTEELRKIYMRNYQNAMTDFEEGYWYAKCREIQLEMREDS